MTQLGEVCCPPAAAAHLAIVWRLQVSGACRPGRRHTSVRAVPHQRSRRRKFSERRRRPGRSAPCAREELDGSRLVDQQRSGSASALLRCFAGVHGCTRPHTEPLENVRRCLHGRVRWKRTGSPGWSGGRARKSTHEHARARATVALMRPNLALRRRALRPSLGRWEL